MKKKIAFEIRLSKITAKILLSYDREGRKKFWLNFIENVLWELDAIERNKSERERYEES